ncbi:MAG: hypothetical protein K6F55_04305 [Eubacterium sp.]|nr:hypothetical protein [Eubacterium sp.]
MGQSFTYTWENGVMENENFYGDKLYVYLLDENGSVEGSDNIIILSKGNNAYVDTHAKSDLWTAEVVINDGAESVPYNSKTVAIATIKKGISGTTTKCRMMIVFPNGETIYSNWAELSIGESFSYTWDEGVMESSIFKGDTLRVMLVNDYGYLEGEDSIRVTTK